MVKYINIIPALTILIIILVFLNFIPVIAQDILTEGENILPQKEILYKKSLGKQLGIKITPKLNYIINENYKEIIEIKFFAEWFNQKNSSNETPDKECIYIINNPDGFPDFVRNVANKYDYSAKGIVDPVSGDIKKTIELLPNNLIRFKPDEYPDQFKDSSRIIKVSIDDKYKGEVIEMKVLFYLGTKTSSKNEVTEKSSKVLNWGFQLPQQRPICDAKYTFYEGRLNQVRPKKNIQDIEGNLPTNENEMIKKQDLESINEDIEEWSLAIYDLSTLKDSIQNENEEYECSNLKDIINTINAYLNNKGKIDLLKERLGIQEQFGDSIQKEHLTLNSYKDQLVKNINTIQQIYRELKSWQYLQTDTNITDIESITDKLNTIDKLKEIEDTLYNWISNKGYADAKIELIYSQFISYYNAARKMNGNTGSGEKGIRNASQSNKQLIRNDKSEKTKTKYLWYLIPLLSFLLGIVAFKYIGNIKKLLSFKSKIKSK
jgi:hypothetical protein